MNLGDVYEEIETKVKADMPALRVVKWGQKPQVPGAMLLLPDSIARTTYRGVRKVTDVVLLILAGRANTREALTDIFNLATQAQAILDPATWVSCSDVTWTETTFDTVTIAGAQDAYLGALLHFDITGTGA
jgi:hypothetical protein